MNAATQGKTGKMKAGTGKKTGTKKGKPKAGTPGRSVLMLGGGHKQTVVEVSPGSIEIKVGSVINMDGIKCFVTGVDPSGNIVFARSVDDKLGATGPLLRADFAESAGVFPEILMMMEPDQLPKLTQADLHDL